MTRGAGTTGNASRGFSTTLAARAKSRNNSGSRQLRKRVARSSTLRVARVREGVQDLESCSDEFLRAFGNIISLINNYAGAGE